MRHAFLALVGAGYLSLLNFGLYALTIAAGLYAEGYVYYIIVAPFFFIYFLAISWITTWSLSGIRKLGAPIRRICLGLLGLTIGFLLAISSGNLRLPELIPRGEDEIYNAPEIITPIYLPGFLLSVAASGLGTFLLSKIVSKRY